MFTSFIRIIKYGFQNFTRNGWLSVATIAIVSLTLMVFLSLVFFDAIADKAVSSLQDKIDISVYFNETTTEVEISGLEAKVAAWPEVKSVEYISRDKALEIFRAEHDADATITAALDELEENPLLPSLNIKANDPRDYGKIDEYLAAEEFAPFVERVTYSQNRLAIERLSKIVETFEAAGLAVSIALALIALLITFNTIRLAIYSNREEISIMRLVGAANRFINGPYLVTGILYGVVAAVVSLVITSPLVIFADPYIIAVIPEMALADYFADNLPGLIGFQLILGAFLGAASSAIAVRKYLKI